MKTLADIPLATTDREAIQAAGGLLVLTSRPLSWRERVAITDALFDVEMEFQVVISTLVVCEEEWEQGPYQVLPIRDEIERSGVAA